jgi:UDP-galactose transporter B1
LGSRGRKEGGDSNGTNGHGNGNGLKELEKKDRVMKPSSVRIPWRKTLPALLLQVSMFQTIAGPIGFLALRHISYPTMVLGKVSISPSIISLWSMQLTDSQSCKLIPVLLLNVLLYRRRFSPHKYIVVSLVTVGISMFMFFGPAKKKGGSDSSWGLVLLFIK